MANYAGAVIGIGAMNVATGEDCPPATGSCPTEKLRFAYLDYVNDSNTTIAADPALTITTTQEDFLKNDWRGYFVQTSETSTEFTISFGGAIKDVNLVVLDKHNIAVDGSVSMSFYDGENGTGSVLGTISATSPHPSLSKDDYVYDYNVYPNSSVFTDWESGSYFSVFYTDATYSCKSLTITIDSSSNPEGYLRLGRIFVSEYISVLVNASWGLHANWKDGITYQQAHGGSIVHKFNGHQLRRILKVDLTELTRAERDYWSNMKRSLQGGTVFVSCFPTFGGTRETHYNLIGKLVSSSGFTHSNFDQFSYKSLTFEEL